MYAKLHLFRPSVALLGALAVSACSTENGPPAATGALTSGRIDAESGQSASVDVRAYNVEADGSLVIASELARTDASGRFAIDTNISDTATAVVVVVEDGSDRMTLLTRATVDARVAESATLTMPPINASSSFDAEVAIAVERRTDGATGEASLDSLFLTSVLSSELAADVDRDASVDAAAGAVLDARATFLATLDAQVDGADRGDASLVIASMAELEGELAIALDAATTVTAEDAAWVAFFDGSIEAMIDAGYDAEAIASASLAARSALDAHLAGHVSSGEASLSVFVAFAMTAAVDADLAARFESSALVSAGTTLRTEVMANARAHADAATTLAAWARYDAAIDAEVAARVSILATALAELSASLDASADALLESWVALGVNASVSSRVEAYASYAESVSSSTNAALLVSGGLDADAAEASLDAMAMINVMSR